MKILMGLNMRKMLKLLNEMRIYEILCADLLCQGNTDDQKLILQK